MASNESMTDPSATSTTLSAEEVLAKMGQRKANRVYAIRYHGSRGYDEIACDWMSSRGGNGGLLDDTIVYEFGINYFGIVHVVSASAVESIVLIDNE